MGRELNNQSIAQSKESRTELNIVYPLPQLFHQNVSHDAETRLLSSALYIIHICIYIYDIHLNSM